MDERRELADVCADIEDGLNSIREQPLQVTGESLCRGQRRWLQTSGGRSQRANETPTFTALRCKLAGPTGFDGSGPAITTCSPEVTGWRCRAPPSAV